MLINLCTSIFSLSHGNCGCYGNRLLVGDFMCCGQHLLLDHSNCKSISYSFCWVYCVFYVLNFESSGFRKWCTFSEVLIESLVITQI